LASRERAFIGPAVDQIEKKLLEALVSDTDEIGDEIGDLMERIGGLQGRRDVAADECLGEW
jgi:hypothetical protein